MNRLASAIEHTLLRPEATKADIERLCQEARTHHFFGVCVNSSRILEAAAFLEDSEVKIITVVGFPLGACDGDVKRFETECAVDYGAHEMDMVLNVGHLKQGDDKAILREIRDIVEAADERPVKLILETGLLTHDEIKRACLLAAEGGAQFVKTSTGFGPRGASMEDIRLMKEVIGGKLEIKASGGIKDRATALAFLDAGATRLGTSSGVKMVV